MALQTIGQIAFKLLQSRPCVHRDEIVAAYVAMNDRVELYEEAASKVLAYAKTNCTGTKKARLADEYLKGKPVSADSLLTLAMLLARSRVRDFFTTVRKSKRSEFAINGDCVEKAPCRFAGVEGRGPRAPKDRSAGVSSDHERRILEALAAGPGGKCEIARRCGLTEQQVNRRLAVLKRDGLIQHTGKRVKSDAGAAEAEYRRCASAN